MMQANLRIASSLIAALRGGLLAWITTTRIRLAKLVKCGNHARVLVIDAIGHAHDLVHLPEDAANVVVCFALLEVLKPFIGNFFERHLSLLLPARALGWGSDIRP